MSERTFIIRVEYNYVTSDGNVLGTWINLIEDFGSDAGQVRYQIWYTDYAVRKQDVRAFVKSHVEFLRTFDITPKIEDRRELVEI